MTDRKRRIRIDIAESAHQELLVNGPRLRERDHERDHVRSQGLLAAATDPRGLRAPPQVLVLIGYVVAAALSSWSATGSVALIAAALVAPIAWGLQWGFLWLVHRMFLSRPWWRHHAFWASMMVMLTIVVIAIVTSVVFGAASATDGWTVLWRWGITVLVTAVAVLSSDYRDDVQVERELQAQLQMARLGGVEQVVSQRGEVVTRMLAMLQEAVTSVTSSSTQASVVITQFAREQVRPLSHELMQALPAVDAPRARSVASGGWRDAVGRLTAMPLVRPTLMAVAVTLLYAITTIQTTTPTNPGPSRETEGGLVVTFDLASFATTLLLLILVFAVTWVSAWAVLRLTRGILSRVSLWRRAVIVLVTPVVIACVLAVVIQIAYVVPGFSEELSSNLFERLWLTVPIVVVAFTILIGRVLIDAITTTRRRLRRSAVNLAWENTRIRNALDQERRFFATQLHGPIQSAAAAAALRLDSLGAATDPSVVLADVERDLTAAIHTLADGPPQRPEMRAEIANLIGTWVGVCEVHVDIVESIIEAFDADWVARGTVVDLLVDAVANAAMHGRAKNVWITAAWLTDDEVGISVTNDGSTDLGEGRGLGSALLDESCVKWSRGIVDGAIQLSFTIAIPRTTVGASAPPSI